MGSIGSGYGSSTPCSWSTATESAPENRETNGSESHDGYDEPLPLEADFYPESPDCSNYDLEPYDPANAELTERSADPPMGADPFLDLIVRVISGLLAVAAFSQNSTTHGFSFLKGGSRLCQIRTNFFDILKISKKYMVMYFSRRSMLCLLEAAVFPHHHGKMGGIFAKKHKKQYLLGNCNGEVEWELRRPFDKTTPTRRGTMHIP